VSWAGRRGGHLEKLFIGFQLRFISSGYFAADELSLLNGQEETPIRSTGYTKGEEG
jgi:hypothetical protein